ncbi:MAG: hypothetical protein CMB80_00675 [Flammeovirgaceae bacterium]|nr:hypothetical protein [Flammeovirgaceae bacterium]
MFFIKKSTMKRELQELEDKMTDKLSDILSVYQEREKVILDIIDHVEKPVSRPGWMTATKGIRTIKKFLTFKEEKDEQVIKK